MAARKSISKKIRFDVFKRDSFICQYCGSKPPSVVLELDHIQPISKGGDNDLDNLLTSCFDCNRGKSDRLLSSLPDTVKQKAALAIEKEAQLKAYKKLKSAVKRRMTRDVSKIEAVFQETFPDQEFTNKFKTSIRNNFLPHIDSLDLSDHMELACSRMPHNSNRAIKYFCGINWNVIRGKD